MKTGEFILIQDDDCHWYVIPSDKEIDFNKWVESDDAWNGIIPKYAQEVGGSTTLVKFKTYTID